MIDDNVVLCAAMVLEEPIAVEVPAWVEAALELVGMAVELVLVTDEAAETA